MSWDVSIIIDTGGEHPACVEEVRNVTYNNSKIFVKLGVHPSDRDNLLCKEWLPLINRALSDSYLYEEELEPLGPSNNWGGLKDVRNFLESLKISCEDHPLAKVRWA